MVVRVKVCNLPPLWFLTVPMQVWVHFYVLLILIFRFGCEKLVLVGDPKVHPPPP